MRRFSFVLAVSVAAASLGVSRANAGSVMSDAATGLVTATGTSAGATVDSTSGSLTSINSSPVSGFTFSISSNITSFTGPIGGYDFITGGTATKVITEGADSVTLNMTITGGIASTGSLTENLVITSVTGSSDVSGFDFYSLDGGTVNLTDSQAGYDFTGLLGHIGVQNLAGTMGVTEIISSVPEPTSVALLGIGMASFFVYRRFVKRTRTA